MFDTEKLISEVEKRPPIYNMKLKEYSSREIKIKLWEEVAVQMYRDWDEISEEEKYKRVREVQTKWKSLKDQFRKELKALKETKSGHSAIKKKKYVYFDQLSFLSSFLEHRNTVSNTSDDDVGDEQQPQRISHGQDIKPSVFTSTTPQIKPSMKRERLTYDDTGEIRKIKKILSESVAVQRDQQMDDKHGNRAFFMSLLPLMNQFSEDMMLECRMRIMKVIQECRSDPSGQNSQFGSTSSNGK